LPPENDDPKTDHIKSRILACPSHDPAKLRAPSDENAGPGKQARSSAEKPETKQPPAMTQPVLTPSLHETRPTATCPYCGGRRIRDPTTINGICGNVAKSQNITPPLLIIKKKINQVGFGNICYRIVMQFVSFLGPSVVKTVGTQCLAGHISAYRPFYQTTDLIGAYQF
jgi:hypothetical protein